jgi:hypothetical protein
VQTHCARRGSSCVSRPAIEDLSWTRATAASDEYGAHGSAPTNCLDTAVGSSTLAGESSLARHQHMARRSVRRAPSYALNGMQGCGAQRDHACGGGTCAVRGSESEGGARAHMGEASPQLHSLSTLLSACNLPAQTSDTILSRALQRLGAAGVVAPRPAAVGEQPQPSSSRQVAHDRATSAGGRGRGGAADESPASRVRHLEQQLRDCTARCHALEEELAVYKQRAAKLVREKVSAPQGLTAPVRAERLVRCRMMC